MSYIEAVFQGIVQGVAEFLPISSSGHLVIFQRLFGIKNPEGLLFFDILLHLGTLVAIFAVYWKEILRLAYEFFTMIRDIFAGRFSWKRARPYRRMAVLILISLLPLFAVIPLKEHIEPVYDSLLFVGLFLMLTSAMLFMADRMGEGHKRPDGMVVGDAVTVGLFQAIAIMPGISRSGATISAGLFRGLTKETAIEFSFLMSIPAVLGAVIVEAKDAFSQAIDPASIGPYLAGTVTAAVVGFFAILFLRGLARRRGFKGFAYYCLVVGALSATAGLFIA